MNQEPTSFSEQSRQAEEATARLKKRMLLVLAGLIVFAIIALPLIRLLDNALKADREEETTKKPSSSILFYEPNFEYNILTDYEYLNLDRSIYYADIKSGVTEAIDLKHVNTYGDAVPVLCSMIDALIHGDADAYNALFSRNFFENHEPELPFTMQRIYDVYLTKVNETQVKPKNGRAYTQFEFEVSYKISKNDGTFRTDIGHDESKKQYFVLSDSTTGKVLIDQILEYNYQ